MTKYRSVKGVRIMITMTTEELRILALGIVSENQSDSETGESYERISSRLAYNNGVLDLMNAILEQKGENK